jgi:hypothetical protein
MSPRRDRRTSVVIGLIAVLCLGLLLPAAGAGNADRSRGAFLVPTGKRTGFGAFQEGPHAAAKLRRAFGSPSEEKAGAFGNCRMTWERLGVAVELEAAGKAKDPCGEGEFVFARLTDRRWHTPSSIHPGSTRAAAEQASRLRCHAGTYACAATGYALELHRDCSGHLFAGVLAHPRGNRIAALNVYDRRPCG